MRQAALLLRFTFAPKIFAKVNFAPAAGVFFPVAFYLAPRLPGYESGPPFQTTCVRNPPEETISDSFPPC